MAMQLLMQIFFYNRGQQLHDYKSSYRDQCKTRNNLIRLAHYRFHNDALYKLTFCLLTD